MSRSDVRVSTRGPLAAGPLRVVCHRRSHVVVSLAAALGEDERPNVDVEWPAYSLVDRQHGRVGLLEGRYDPGSHRLHEPRYTTLSVPEALQLAPEVAELMAEDEARWSRVSPQLRLADLVRIGILPGAGTLDSLLRQLAPEPDHRMPPEMVGPSPAAVRPELLLSLMVIHRRYPELVFEHGERVRAKVRLALSRMSAEQKVRHAAEAAHAVWTILADRDGALELLADWKPPLEHVQVNHAGADALALPDALVFAHLARCNLASDVARAFCKHHLLDPAANELGLEAALPLPAGFFGGLPRIDERWLASGQTSADEALVSALIGQFDWPRVGGALVSAWAAAGVDRMPGPGPRPPDKRGVLAAVHVVNDSPRAVQLEIGRPSVDWRGEGPRRHRIAAPIPGQIPALSAMTIELGALDDATLEPGAGFEVLLPLRIAGASHQFSLRGTVSVAW